MLYLCLAVLCSSVIAIVMRLSGTKIKNNLCMFAVNYAVCILIARFYTGHVPLLVKADGIGTAVLLGLISGILYLVNFILLQFNTLKNGVVLSSTFMKLGVLVPTIMAIAAFHEIPQFKQIFGFILACLAIVLIHFEKTDQKSSEKIWLIIMLLVSGITDSLSKVYEQYGSPDLKNHFLFYTFIAAFAISLVLMVIKRTPVGKMDVLFGILLGIPNYFSARFLLLSLTELPAIVVYPVCNVATIVVVNICGIIIFHEKLSKKQAIAIGMILLALILLN